MTNNDTNKEYCNPFDEKPQNFFMKLEHCGRYLYAFDNISNSDIVADISCATGYGSYLLAQKAKKVIGCDINNQYLNMAKKNHVKANLDFIQIDISKNIDLLKDKVSAIVSFETIEHTLNPFEIITKFYNILPHNGRLILSFPNSKYELTDENGKNQDSFHLSVIDYKKMKFFLQKTGFEITQILGQSLVNKLFEQTLKIENDLNLSFDNIFNYQKENIIAQSRILAYPNDIDIEKSYSYIFDLKKL